MGKNKDKDKYKNQAPQAGGTATAVLDKKSEWIATILISLSTSFLSSIIELVFPPESLIGKIAIFAIFFGVSLALFAWFIIKKNKIRLIWIVILVLLAFFTVILMGICLSMTNEKVQHLFKISSSGEYPYFELIVASLLCSAGAASSMIGLALCFTNNIGIKTKPLLWFAFGIVLLSCWNIYSLSKPYPDPIPEPPLEISLYDDDPKLEDKYKVLGKKDYRNCSASSTYKDNDRSYPVDNVISNVEYPWMEQQHTEDLENEDIYIQLRFIKPETIQIIGLWPGFKGVADYARPKTVRFEFSGGVSVESPILKDVDEMQYLQLSKPVNTQYIKITILDVYSHGSQQICIHKVETYRAKD